jgi:hypothetical protein
VEKLPMVNKSNGTKCSLPFFLETPGLVDELQWAELTTLSNEESRIFYGNQINEKMVYAIGRFNEGGCTVSLFL